MVREVDVRGVDFRRDDDKDGRHHTDDHKEAKQDASVEQQLPRLRHSLRPFSVSPTRFFSCLQGLKFGRVKETMSESEGMTTLCVLAALVGEKEKKVKAKGKRNSKCRDSARLWFARCEGGSVGSCGFRSSRARHALLRKLDDQRSGRRRKEEGRGNVGGSTSQEQAQREGNGAFLLFFSAFSSQATKKVKRVDHVDTKNKGTCKNQRAMIYALVLKD